jgi:DNA-binding transcriptional MocR family regulator
MYQQVADALRHAITSGAYPPGSSLPTHAVLGERHRVGRDTVRDALDVLTDETLIITQRGVPARVRPRIDRQRITLPGGVDVTARIPTRPELDRYGLDGAVPIFEIRHPGHDAVTVYAADRTVLTIAACACDNVSGRTAG